MCLHSLASLVPKLELGNQRTVGTSEHQHELTGPAIPQMTRADNAHAAGLAYPPTAAAQDKATINPGSGKQSTDTVAVASSS